MDNLKTIKLNVIKKNRVYFACKTESGYSVKLKITPESENLTLGEHVLLVHDISVRSKYGVDVIYSLSEEIKKDDGVVTLKHAYNDTLVKKCRDLGGRWDTENKIWVFPRVVAEAVEELEYLYTSDLVDVEIEYIKEGVIDSDCREPIYFLGYVLARAQGRDSGATLGEGVALMKGRVGSNGSQKNWGTYATEGSIFRLKISKNLLKEKEELFKDEWKVTIL